MDHTTGFAQEIRLRRAVFGAESKAIRNLVLINYHCQEYSLVQSSCSKRFLYIPSSIRWEAPGTNAPALFNRIKTINRRQFQPLDCTARPVNLNALNRSRRPQPEVHPEIVRRGVTASADHVPSLPDAASN